jgi:hypothetical protein
MSCGLIARNSMPWLLAVSRASMSAPTPVESQKVS